MGIYVSLGVWGRLPTAPYSVYWFICLHQQENVSKLSGLSQVVGYEARLQEGEVEQDGESGTSGVHLIIILSLHTVGMGLEDEQSEAQKQ